MRKKIGRRQALRVKETPKTKKFRAVPSAGYGIDEGVGGLEPCQMQATGQMREMVV